MNSNTNTWTKIKLGDISEINPRTDLPENGDLKVGFISMADVSNDALIVNIQEKKLSDVVKGFTRFKKGDVLFAKITPCMENGKGGICTDEKYPIYFGSTEFHVLRAKGDVLPKYLHHMVNSPVFRLIAEKQMTGSAGQKRVPTEFLKNYHAFLPPKNIQEKIVNLLSSIDEEIYKVNEIIFETEKLKNGLFNEIISNGYTWKKVKLGEIASFKNGINFSKDQKGEVGILTLDVFNMFSASIFVNTSNLYRVNVEDKNYKDYLLQSGDILFVRSSVKKEGVGWASLYNNLNEEALFCGFLIRARLTTDFVLPEYLVHYLRSTAVRQKIIASSGQSAITNISQQSLQSFEVAIPTMDEQSKIVTILTSLDKKLSSEKNTLEQLKKMKNGLVQDIFNRKVLIS